MLEKLRAGNGNQQRKSHSACLICKQLPNEHGRSLTQVLPAAVMGREAGGLQPHAAQSNHGQTHQKRGGEHAMRSRGRLAGGTAQAVPGFNLLAAWTAHLATVRCACYNAKGSNTLSVDVHGLRAWVVRGGVPRLLHEVPCAQDSVITAMTVSQEPLNLVFAACLDGSLRIYSGDKLRLRSSMPWHNGVVRDMRFNVKTHELFTAGSYGVKSWRCELDHEEYRSDTDVDPAFVVPRNPDGSIIPWGFGKYQHARLHRQFK